MTSRIHKLFTAQAAVVDTVSATVRPQHVSDEKGTFQVQASADPGAAKNGGITLEGRLSPEANWVVLETVLFSGAGSLNVANDAGGAGIGTVTVIVEDVSILPEMRAGMRANATGFNPDATNITAWLME